MRGIHSLAIGEERDRNAYFVRKTVRKEKRKCQTSYSVQAVHLHSSIFMYNDDKSSFYYITNL